MSSLKLSKVDLSYSNLEKNKILYMEFQYRIPSRHPNLKRVTIKLEKGVTKDKIGEVKIIQMKVSLQAFDSTSAVQHWLTLTKKSTSNIQ